MKWNGRSVNRAKLGATTEWTRRCVNSPGPWPIPASEEPTWTR